MHKLPSLITPSFETCYTSDRIVLSDQPYIPPRPKGADLIDFWRPGEMYYTTSQVFGDKTDLMQKRSAQREAQLKEIEDDFNAMHGSAGNTVKIHKGMQVGPSVTLLNNVQTYIDTWTYLNPGSLLTCLENDKEEMIVKFLVLTNNGGHHDDDTGSTEPFYMWLDYSNGMGGVLGFSLSEYSNQQTFEIYNENSMEDRELVCENYKRQQEEQTKHLVNWSNPLNNPMWTLQTPPAVINNTTILPAVTHTHVNNITQNEVKPEHFTYCNDNTKTTGVPFQGGPNLNNGNDDDNNEYDFNYSNDNEYDFSGILEGKEDNQFYLSNNNKFHFPNNPVFELDNGSIVLYDDVTQTIKPIKF